ncbi:MAG: deoxyribodipyrimidine photo-lyase [Thermoplasmata archaeon]
MDKLKDIQNERIQSLNDNGTSEGDFVFYWMQQSQRTEYNHALEYAVEKANELDKPLIVFFGLNDDFPDANERHYHFMLEGLEEVNQSLKDRNIGFLVRHVSPEEGVVKLYDKASMIVTDRGYLDIQKEWRGHAAENVDCPLVQVESDVVVPVETVSEKEEYATRTIRPKIYEKLDRFLKPLEERDVKLGSLEYSFENNLAESDVKEIISKLDIDRSVKPVDNFQSGTSNAKDRLDEFIENKLDGYPDHSNDPTKNYLSGMSPYLHFGQISPLYIALEVKKADSPGEKEYLEQLIVRRELAMNFVHYSERYNSLDCVPEWARESLNKHKEDDRDYIYTRDEWEKAETHDKYWNAAQKEMIKTGKMHGYMRMYWGKKILEWSETPEKAFQTALYLNNKYELDGRDPNGYTGVAWCFGKHDQGWKERPIYGKVRYMNANGLKRKFDADKYIEMIEEI